MTWFRKQGVSFGLYTITPGYLDARGLEWGVPRDSFSFDWQSKPTLLGRVLALLNQKIRVILSVARMMRLGGYDLLYLNTLAYVSPLLAARVLRRKTVVHVREGSAYLATSGSRKKWILNGFRRWVLRHCVDRFICVSRYVADIVNETLSVENAIPIHNGIHIDREPADDASRSRIRAELGFGEEDFLVLCVGRIQEEKGVHDLLVASELASSSIDNLKVAFLGGPLDTPYFHRVIEPMLDKCPSGQFRFAGYTDNVTDYYQAADLFVHPAVYDEPLARTILEAMGHEMCVLATCTGGTPEIIDDGVNGFLVEPRMPAKMAARMIMLAKSPELRARSARAARITIDVHFSESRYVKEVLAEVRSLLLQAT